MGMIINHNLSALNTYNQLNTNNTLMNNSLQKLSSGYRINSAADDAAGLAISEKMRGQIRGLDQANANAQDAISMTQTAEGALDETTSILQRMRELAVQASTDTLTEDDRTAVQDEMDALTSEINRIGNTTEFNTKKLLKGDGTTNLDNTNISGIAGNLAGGTDMVKTQANTITTIATAANTVAAADTLITTVSGVTMTLTFAVGSTTNGDAGEAYNVTSTSATINGTGTGADATYTATNGKTKLAVDIAAAYQDIIDKNDILKGQYTATADTATGVVTIQAVKGGTFDGVAGAVSVYSGTLVGTEATAGTATAGTTTSAVAASKTIALNSFSTDATISALVGSGFTVNGQQVEFYNANDGAYTGTAIGINISDALAATATQDQALAATIATQLGSKIDGVTFTASTSNLIITASEGGADGNSITLSDGGVQENFEATFQIGANTGQTMSLSIEDMRSKALEVSSTTSGGSITVEDSDGNDVTAYYKSVMSVTDGTSDTESEYSLDVSTAEKATAAISVIDDATSTVSATRSKLGAVINRLEHTINNLTTTSENMTSAESRIRDVDMASEMATYTNKSVLNQAATAMLAKANQQPQQVLSLLQG